MLSVMNHVQSIFSTVWGWILIVSTYIFSYIWEEKTIFIVAIFAILFDLFWGVRASLKLKKFMLSSGIRETFNKILVYCSILLILLVIERLIHENTLIAARAVCVLMAACELYSASASMLIVNPNMPFLKLFRMQLKGEIEKKTGINTDKIFNDENGNT